MTESTLIADLDAWTVEDSRSRGTKRWSRFPSDVIDLTVAEMDLPTAEPVMAAIRSSVEHEAFGYPLTEEYNEFQPVTAAWLADHGLSVPERAIFMLSDVMKGMGLALDHMVEADTPVAVITPTYSAFFDTLWVTRRERIEVAMRRDPDRGYELDLDAVAAAFEQGARSLLLCHPSNPTGAIFPRQTLRELAALSARFGARVLSDEVHAPIRYTEEPHVPYASVSDEARATAITLTSASKSWNIPGLRCAVIALTNPEDVPIWQALPGGAKGGISPIGINATIAAFTAGQAWLDAARELLEQKRDRVVAALNGLGHGTLIHPPSATYLGWMDLAQFGWEQPAARLMERARLAVTAGDEHGAAGAGFVRINLATPWDALDDMLDRFARVLGD
jgi:cysteine-S-conjugate beta-lyase